MLTTITAVWNGVTHYSAVCSCGYRSNWTPSDMHTRRKASAHAKKCAAARDTQAAFDAARAKYGRTFNRLHALSARANSAAESDLIDALLVKANAEYAAARATITEGGTA